MEKISAFVDENGIISSFLDGKYLYLFEKDEKWKLAKNIELDSSKLKSMTEMRNYYSQLISKLEDCKILIVKKALGIPYSIFYQEDFSIWEFEGKPEEYFEAILERENEHVKEVNEEFESEKKLVKVLKPGYYIINLDEVQRKKPDLTSKMVVRPFLEKDDFETLEIHCCHTPPWLEAENSIGIIKMKVETLSKEHVVLYISKR